MIPNSVYGIEIKRNNAIEPPLIRPFVTMLHEAVLCYKGSDWRLCFLMILAWCLIPNWFDRISICCYSLNIHTLFQTAGVKISYDSCLLRHPEINVITQLKYFTLYFNRLHRQRIQTSKWIHTLPISVLLFWSTIHMVAHIRLIECEYKYMAYAVSINVNTPMIKGT